MFEGGGISGVFDVGGGICYGVLLLWSVEFFLSC